MPVTSANAVPRIFRVYVIPRRSSPDEYGYVTRSRVKVTLFPQFVIRYQRKRDTFLSASTIYICQFAFWHNLVPSKILRFSNFLTFACAYSLKCFKLFDREQALTHFFVSAHFFLSAHFFSKCVFLSKCAFLTKH